MRYFVDRQKAIVFAAREVIVFRWVAWDVIWMFICIAELAHSRRR